MMSLQLCAKGNAAPGSSGSLYSKFIALNGLRNNAVQPLSLVTLAPLAPASPQLYPRSTDHDVSTGGDPNASNGYLLEATDPPSDPLLPTGGTHATTLSPDPADPLSPTGGAPHAISPYYISTEEKANAAIISFNTFNIIDPPIPLFFGTDTSKKLRTSKVDTLVKKFIDDFRPFTWEATIKVLLKIDDIDPQYINRDITMGRSAPELRLTYSERLAGKVLVTCGGYHRYMAVCQILKKLRNERRILNKRRTKMMRGEERNSTLQSSTTLTLIEIDEKLRCIAEQQVLFATWGVIVYDAGMSLPSA